MIYKLEVFEGDFLNAPIFECESEEDFGCYEGEKKFLKLGSEDGSSISGEIIDLKSEFDEKRNINTQKVLIKRGK